MAGTDYKKGIGFLSSLEGTPKYYNLLSEIRGTTDYFYAVDADKKTTILDNDGNPLSTENPEV